MFVNTFKIRLNIKKQIYSWLYLCEYTSPKNKFEIIIRDKDKTKNSFSYNNIGKDVIVTGYFSTMRIENRMQYFIVSEKIEHDVKNENMNFLVLTLCVDKLYSKNEYLCSYYRKERNPFTMLVKTKKELAIGNIYTVEGEFRMWRNKLTRRTKTLIVAERIFEYNAANPEFIKKLLDKIGFEAFCPYVSLDDIYKDEMKLFNDTQKAYLFDLRFCGEELTRELDQ